MRDGPPPIAVDHEEPLVEALRLQVVVEVDPDALGLDAAAAAPVTEVQRRAAEAAMPLHHVVSSTSCPRGTAPRHRARCGARPRRASLVEARVEPVVRRDVLEVARDRVEPQPAVRVGVGEADRPSCAVAARLTRADGGRALRPPPRPPHELPRRDARRRRSSSTYDATPSRSSSSQPSSCTPRRNEARGGARRTAAGRRRGPGASPSGPASADRASLTSRPTDVATSGSGSLKFADVVRAEEDDDEVDRRVRVQARQEVRRARSGLPRPGCRSSRCGRSAPRRSPPTRRRARAGAAPASAPRAGSARRRCPGRSPTCSSRRSRRTVRISAAAGSRSGPARGPRRSRASRSSTSSCSAWM